MVNELIQSESDRQRLLAGHLMKSLEKLRDISAGDHPGDLVDLLERLTKLHSEGGLSDIEFEQAKKRALGL